MPQVFAQGGGIAEFLRLQDEVEAEVVVGGFGVVVAFGEGGEGDAVVAVGFEVFDEAAPHVGDDGVEHAAGKRAEVGGGDAGKQGEFGFPGAAAEGVHAQGGGKAGVALRREHGHGRQAVALQGDAVRVEGGFLQADDNVGLVFRRPFRLLFR